jgi:hypothetical protein
VICFPLRDTVSHIQATVEGRCSLLNMGSKGQRSSALDIEVEIWFHGSRVTPYHKWDVRYPRFYQVLFLSTQERGNLYLLTPFKSLGHAGGMLVSLALYSTVCMIFGSLLLPYALWDIWVPASTLCTLGYLGPCFYPMHSGIFGSLLLPYALWDIWVPASTLCTLGYIFGSLLLPFHSHSMEYLGLLEYLLLTARSVRYLGFIFSLQSVVHLSLCFYRFQSVRYQVTAFNSLQSGRYLGPCILLYNL